MSYIIQKCQALWGRGNRQYVLFTATLKLFSKDAVILEDYELDMTRFHF